MSAPDTRLVAALRVVGAAAWLVPARLRDDWRREWHGELATWAADGRRGAVRHAVGAFADAFWLRQRQLGDARWIDDLRHGWRQLRGHAGFAATAIGVLALGMAASITAFTVVAQVLLRPLPYPDADRVVTVAERQSAAAGALGASPGNFFDWRERATTFATLAGAEPYSRDYTDGERPEVWRAANVTPGFFESLGVAPRLGRTFADAEYTKGRHRVAVISARLWRSRFAADPAVIGRRVTLDAEPWEIVGVMPDDFFPGILEDTPGAIAVWAPKVVEDYERRIRGNGFWEVVGRLRPGVSVAQANDELDRISRALAAEHPRTNHDVRAVATPLREHLVGDVRPAVGLFAVAVGVVLLIACVNVTNLLLARGAARRHELAVRHALGASRGRLLAQLLGESLLLSVLAAAVGLALAHGATRLLARVGPPNVPWVETLRVDAAAASFAALLAGAVTVIAGLLPAWRLAAVGVAATRTTTGDRSQRRLRAALVAGEVALAIVLASGAGLLLRSFVNLAAADTGFERRGVAALQLFAWDRNPGPDRLRAFFDRVLDGVAALPGVEAVGAVSAMPFIDASIEMRSVFQIVGDPAPAAGEEARGSLTIVTPGFFTTLRVPVLRGRALDAGDAPGRPRVAVITQAMADRYFRDRDPIGRRLTFTAQGRPTEVEIVGVVAALRHERLDVPPRAEVMLPFAQAPFGSMTVVARTGGDPAALIPAAMQATWAVDPLQTFYQTATLEDLVRRTTAARRFALAVLGGFTAIALVLAAAGLYAVLTAVAVQYRREIGVRLAMGARWGDILALVMGRGVAVVAVGLVAGVAGAVGTGRLLAAFLVSVSPADPWAIGGAAVVLSLVALPACLVPARRAANTSPSEVLRAE